MTRYRNDGGVRKPSIFHLPTSFPKQILTPSRFKLTLLINNGINWKDQNSCSFWAENFGRSLEGQGGPTRGSKYSIQSFKWKPTTCAKTHKLRNSKKHFKQWPKAAKGWCRLRLAANNQATRRNEIIKSYLQLGSSSNRYAPRLPQQEPKSSTKQLAPTDPILGPENLLKTGFAQKGLPSCPSGRQKPRSFIDTKNVALLPPWYKKLQKMNLNTVPKMGPPGGPIFGTACTT